MKLAIFILMILTASLLSAQADPFSWSSAESHLETAQVSNNTAPQISLGFYTMNTNEDYPARQASLSVKVPEPATLFLLGSGLIGLASTVRRKHKYS